MVINHSDVTYAPLGDHFQLNAMIPNRNSAILTVVRQRINQNHEIQCELSDSRNQ